MSGNNPGFIMMSDINGKVLWAYTSTFVYSVSV